MDEVIPLICRHRLWTDSHRVVALVDVTGAHLLFGAHHEGGADFDVLDLHPVVLALSDRAVELSRVLTRDIVFDRGRSSLGKQQDEQHCLTGGGKYVMYLCILCWTVFGVRIQINRIFKIKV